MGWEYGQYIWDRLYEDIGNEIGVAGLMGNLVAESNLIPYRLQGDFTNGYVTSIEYTEQVDNGTVSEYDFVNNGPNGGGYGLAQWTFPARKQNLYNLKVERGVSIGDLVLAVDFLILELHGEFRGVRNVLINATSLREASDYVLHNFERPADQSVEAEIRREGLCQSVYNTYANTEPNPNPDPDPTPDPEPPTPSPTTKIRCMPIWMYSQFREQEVIKW